MTDIIKELEDRGYIEQLTHEKEMRELFQKESVRFYIGIDPTANSMHIGHFVALMVAARLQKAGHRPIILMGGGTAAIGDPSGRTDMRQMLTREQLDANVEAIKKQAEREMKIKDKVKEQFILVKDMLGYRPSRVELLTYMING